MPRTKQSAILALSVLLACSLAQGQKNGHLTNHEAEKAQQNEQSAPPPAAIDKGAHNFVPDPASGKTKSDGRQNTDSGVIYVTTSDNPFHFWLPFFINTMIALIGVVTAVAVMLQVRGLVLSQRAWILVVPDSFDPQRPLYGPEMKNDLKKFPISIKNVGVSPARIDSVAFRYCVLEDLSTLPPNPVYPKAIPYNGWIVAPQDTVGHIASLEDDQNIPVLEYDQCILKGTKVVFAYGYVKYRDIFNRERETRISYAYEYFWLSAALQPSRRIKQVGPAKYNEST